MATYPKKTGITNFDDVVYYLEKQIEAVGGLPAVTASDNGKALIVANGVWGAGNIPKELPPLPEEDGEYSLSLVIDGGVPGLVWDSVGE